MSGFKDTDEYEKGWNCRSTGKKKDKTFKELKATDKSYITGYYQGSRTVKNEKNPNQPNVLHKILATEIGDVAHSPALEKEMEIREFFGTTVINKKLAEKATRGQLVKIVWVGKVEPKNGGDQFHDWKLFIDESAAPVLVGSAPTSSAPAKSKAAEGDTSSAEESPADDDDDEELPF